MKRDYGGVGTIALRASALLKAMSQDIEDQRKEFNQTEYYQTFTRNAVAKLPKLSRRIVEQAIKEMEDDGYQFNKKQVGNVEQYALTIQNVIDIYAHRKIPKYRDIHKSPYVIFVVNLKGGVSKTVSLPLIASKSHFYCQPPALHWQQNSLKHHFGIRRFRSLLYNRSYSAHIRWGTARYRAAGVLRNRPQAERRAGHPRDARRPARRGRDFDGRAAQCGENRRQSARQTPRRSRSRISAAVSAYRPSV